MILFKEEAGTYPEKTSGAAGEKLFRKFVSWKPAEYDTDGEVFDYGAMKFKRLFSIEMYNVKYSKVQPNGMRTESATWDFTGHTDEFRPTVLDFVTIPPSDYELWEGCHIDAYVAVPDLMTVVTNMQDVFENVLNFMDGGNFSRGWDEISDENEFEKAFAAALQASGLKVDIDKQGLGVLEFTARKDIKIRLTLK